MKLPLEIQYRCYLDLGSNTSSFVVYRCFIISGLYVSAIITRPLCLQLAPSSLLVPSLVMPKHSIYVWLLIVIEVVTLHVSFSNIFLVFLNPVKYLLRLLTIQPVFH
jgi:hypothetical protein